MSVKINAKEEPLSEIFSRDYSFTIPLYQRPYAWTTVQAGELFADLMSFLGDNDKEIDEITPYFLGSIVLIKKDYSPESEIVDGQQRITTLTILLSVMRTVITGTMAIGVTKYLYEEGDEIIYRPNQYRLKLRRDEVFFRDKIQHEGGLNSLFSLDKSQLSFSEKNIQANADWFKRALEKISEEHRIRLLRYLMNRCYLVVVSTPDLDSAFRIFSVLNARGLELGLTDLLKPEIIGTIPESSQEKYTRIWESEEESLGRDAFQDLFSHIRMIFRKSKLRETALNEFKNYILLPNKIKDSISFIDNIVKPYSKALEIVKTAKYRSDKESEGINSAFRWLNQIDNFDWVPPSNCLFIQKFAFT